MLATMAIEYALLGYVAERPAHGYEIYQQLRAPDGLWQVWRMKQSQLYALLARLEGEGLLAATLEPQAARPPRKIFALTGQGERAFAEWLATPVEHGRQMRLEFLAKLYFALRHEPSAAARLIAIQREICLSWQEDLPFTVRPADSSPFSRSVSAFRRSQIDAFLHWLDECEKLIPHQP